MAAEVSEDQEAFDQLSERLASALAAELNFLTAPRSEWLIAARGILAKMGTQRVGNLWTRKKTYIPTFAFQSDKEG